MNDLQDMRGFDPNSSLAMDQSIMVHDTHDAPFKADESVVHHPGYRPPSIAEQPTQNLEESQRTQRAATMASSTGSEALMGNNEDVKLHPNQLLAMKVNSQVPQDDLKEPLIQGEQQMEQVESQAVEQTQEEPVEKQPTE